MTSEQFKNRIGRFILITNFLLFGVLFIYYIIAGLDNDEFLELIKLFAPIKAVYITALVKHIISNRVVINDEEIKAPILKPLYKTVTTLMIYTHILSLILVVTLYALFNAMEFVSLKNIIVFIETFFGSYIGLIITSLFGESIEKKWLFAK